MAVINIPVGGGTFTANSGDVFNIASGATGNITINVATDFTVNITGDLTGGGGDSLRTLQFGADLVPTVNIAGSTSPFAGHRASRSSSCLASFASNLATPRFPRIGQRPDVRS